MAKGGMVAKKPVSFQGAGFTPRCRWCLVFLEAVPVSLCAHMEVNFGCDVCQLADVNATSVLRAWVAVAEQPVACC